jgi:hypothetical protein
MFIVFFKSASINYTFQLHVADEQLADTITINYRRIGFYAWCEKA